VSTKEQDEEVIQLIEACTRQDRRAQKELYKLFYSLSMKICLRYAGDKQEAVVIKIDGFLRAFTSIAKYDLTRPFKTWLGKIMANAAVDHYRSRLRFISTELDDNYMQDYLDQEVYDTLNYKDLLVMIQSLSPAYRTVFNLFAIEGYSHEEIAKLLNISVGTSKSNLFKARAKLTAMIRLSDEQAISKKETN